MKSTPGPWAVRNEIDVFAAGEYICTTSGNVKANARLIASAPDLLEACKDILSIIPSHPENRESIEKCYKAIAKAEGRK